jgi:hypothetical protein
MDAEFKEHEHARNESGQFTSGGGGGGASEKTPHRRDSKAVLHMTDPLGWHHMKDADGNVWRHSEKHHALVASNKAMPDQPGGGWLKAPEIKAKRMIPRGMPGGGKNPPPASAAVWKKLEAQGLVKPARTGWEKK